MTAKDLEHTIKALGLTQMGLARFLDVDGRTVRYWIAGRRKVPGPVSVLLRLMIALEVSPEDVKARIG